MSWWIGGGMKKPATRANQPRQAALVHRKVCPKEMAIPDSQLRACLSAVGDFLVKRRPPVHIREQLDFRADIKGSELVIVEVRPAFRDKTQTVEHPVEKAKWVGTRKLWRLFWMRADLKWHSYDPLPEAPDIKTLIGEVERDPHCCFFG